MGVMFDIIGSIMVRTAIVLIVLRMNVSLNSMITETVAHATIQQELSILRDVMTSDFEYAGWHASGTPMITATASEIKFSADIDNDGTPETVRYYYGATSELSNTSNPDDRKLYREVNGGTALNVANGITKCEFKYYNNVGVTTSTLANIKMFSVTITMQDGTAIDGRYPTTYWEQLFYPQNL